jgi:hypothetical protein
MEQTPSQLGTYSPSPDDEDVLPAQDPFEEATEASANPYETNFVPEELRLQPSELPSDLRDRVYTFCRATTVANLRKMAKIMSAPTHETKGDLVD